MKDSHYNYECRTQGRDFSVYEERRAWVSMVSDHRREEQEKDYWEGMYPREVRQLKELIGQVCDRLDRPGSFLYDEWPDRILLLQLCERIEDLVRGGNLSRNREKVFLIPKSGGTWEEGKREWTSLIRLLLVEEIRERRKRKKQEKDEWL